ncbi:MAG: benzoyl-CoA reductase subunit A [Planctomycetes bacterium]|nr:benzoyl-CoA reductase subunit A [Planctomycetota bacterium]
MEYCIGVDLGSTTTKAVILGADHAVLGRGITNSRSNYVVASQVAMGEALINTRFTRIRNQLGHAGVGPARCDQLLGSFERRFREQQYLCQLATLESTLHGYADRTRQDPAVHRALDAIVARMRSESAGLFAEGAARKSDFFRDLAGSRFHELSEQQKEARFDVLAGLFDKSILDVENSTEAVGTFSEHARAALQAQGTHAPELARAVDAAFGDELVQVQVVGTGYGRQKLPFPEKSIRSEILCHGLGAHAMYPHTRTVLDIGGQDTKAIQVDEQGIVTSFQMNDRCAAGCGRYLGYIADEMNLGLHELGPLAGQATRQVRINSTCTVFAGAELRERLSLGERREDILAGLHRAIVLRAMSLLARSGGVHEQFTFTGGVARNSEAVKALRKLVQENYGERTLNISTESIYTGALGAALFAWRAAERADVPEEVKA